jgi:hypothetical protein
MTDRIARRQALRYIAGENPLEWLTRRGWSIHCYPGARVAKRKNEDGTTTEYTAENTRARWRWKSDGTRENLQKRTRDAVYPVLPGMRYRQAVAQDGSGDPPGTDSIGGPRKGRPE